MATTTPEAFRVFYERIRPSVKFHANVATRQKSVTESLRTAFPSTSDMKFGSVHLVGSLGRQTASKPFDDIDLLVRLHVDETLWSSTYQFDSTTFLYRVREKLNATSAVKKVGARGQAVRLFYADGPRMDVAAAVKYTSGSYGIPDGEGNWLKTNPIQHAIYVNQRNSALGSNLKRFVIILKQWNQAHSSRLQSFHLEILATRTFSSLSTNSRSNLNFFFDFNQFNLSVQDPAAFSGDLSSYLTKLQREAVNTSLAKAHEQSGRAKQAEGKGDHREAMRLWKVILGDDFPDYG